MDSAIVNDQQTRPRVLKISSRTLTGVASLQNKGAIDWGPQGLLAYGSNYAVVVVDTVNIQPIQTLDKHRAVVHKVRWSTESHYHSVANPYALTLASADATGHIIVWDVQKGNPNTVLQDGNKQIQDLEWVSGVDNSEHLLVALHPPYSFILWDTKSGTKLWKKTYTETLVSFDFDPFEHSKLAFLCQDCILFVDDFTLNKVPSSNGHKFYVSTPRVNPLAATGNLGSSANLTFVGQEEKQRAKDRLKRLMKELVVGETKPKPEDSMTVNECLQLSYLRSVRHNLLLLYPREILILDLHINQTVGIIPVEKSGLPLMQVISCQQRDVLYCLHESGSVSARFRRRQFSVASSPLEAPAAGSISNQDSNSLAASDVCLEVAYEQRCQSESIRLTKHTRILGMACNPICERRLALFMTDGRLIFLELRPITFTSSGVMSPLYTPGYADVRCFIGGDHSQNMDILQPPRQTLNDIVGPSWNINKDCGDISHHSASFRLLMTSLLSNLAAPPLTIRMCPPLTTHNWQQYVPLMVAGTSSGAIQVYNMATGLVEKEFLVHVSPVRGIEWISLSWFLSYAHQYVTGQQGLVRNELIVTDYRTGKCVPLRVDKGEEQPISMIRISYLKQYLIVAFKDSPFELWDLRNFTLLRTMPKKFPIITALEWSPRDKLKSMRKRLVSLESREGLTSSTSVGLTLGGGDAGKTELQDKQLIAKEHFVFTDTDGQLYHFSVEGNVIQDGTRVHTESGIGSVTCIAWKGDQIVRGDVDGNINIWDLKKLSSKKIQTGRGWVRKMRFAPGKGNMKLLVLYSDGVDIWDSKDVSKTEQQMSEGNQEYNLQQVEHISQLKCPKDMVKIQDVDWAASDKPVLATMDGCLRVMDLNLKTSTSLISEYEKQDAVLCPHLLPHKVALNLQSLLQYQPRRKEYSLHFNTDDGFSSADLSSVKQQVELLDPRLQDFLHCCPLGTAQRSMLTARIFGDKSELLFWTVALYYLQAAKAGFIYQGVKKKSTYEEGGDIFVPTEMESHEKNTRNQNSVHIHPLDTCYDVLCDCQTYQKLQLDRVTLHENKRVTYGHTVKAVEKLILLGETDHAVQLLLETEDDNPNYYTDSLRACLVATIRSSGASQSTIKLVATNLIANGKVWEGVQLLCLIDKGLDACRYLQSSGLWEESVWLAKSTLPYSECVQVVNRWADHLSNNGQKNKAVLILISMGQFQKSLELLISLQYHQRAAVFLHACQECGLLERTSATESLFDAIQLKYARTLFDIGNHLGALHVCDNLGEIGQQLKKEFEILAAE